MGIAPGARLVNMRVGTADGGVDVSQIIAVIDWVVQHRQDDGLNIRVINLAYGTHSTQPYTVDPLAYAVENAWSKGVVVVSAAGNDGAGAGLTMPAAAPYGIAVGAVDHLGTNTLGADGSSDVWAGSALDFSRCLTWSGVSSGPVLEQQGDGPAHHRSCLRGVLDIEGVFKTGLPPPPTPVSPGRRPRAPAPSRPPASWSEDDWTARSWRDQGGTPTTLDEVRRAVSPGSDDLVERTGPAEGAGDWSGRISAFLRIGRAGTRMLTAGTDRGGVAVSEGGEPMDPVWCRHVAALVVERAITSVR